jgi:hypothetical protein
MTFAFVKTGKQGETITGFFIEVETGRVVPVKGTVLQTTTKALLNTKKIKILRSEEARPYLKAQGMPLKPMKKAVKQPKVEKIKIAKAMIEQYAAVQSQALDAAYHYGISQPGTFGAAAGQSSAKAILSKIMNGITDIEKLAAASHIGWGRVAKTYDDPVYKEKPQKRETRLALANTPYKNLPEEEKEKDRVAARAILAAFTGRAAMEKQIEQTFAQGEQIIKEPLEIAELPGEAEAEKLAEQLEEPKGYDILEALGFRCTKSDGNGDHFHSRGKYKDIKIVGSYQGFSISHKDPWYLHHKHDLSEQLTFFKSTHLLLPPDTTVEELRKTIEEIINYNDAKNKEYEAQEMKIKKPTGVKLATTGVTIAPPGFTGFEGAEIPGVGIPIRAEGKPKKEKVSTTTLVAKPVTTTKKAAVTGARLEDLRRFTGNIPTLQGLTLYITGSHPDYTKDQLEAMVVAKGGIFKAPSGKTKLLVIGEGYGQTRIDAAKQHDIPWMPLAEFMQYL